MEYLGYVSRYDRLYGYLKYDIQPFVRPEGDPEYCVYRLSGSNEVYLYEEQKTRTKIIGKFFQSQFITNPDMAYRNLCREFHHLNLVRHYGFSKGLHYVPRPLGSNPNLNHLLVSEFCYGELLGTVINRAIDTRDDGLLYQKLSALASFLGDLHNKTAEASWTIDFHENANYMGSLIQVLQQGGLISHTDELLWLQEQWRHHGKMWEDSSVLVHGDATPANFMFGDNMHVVGLDWERLHRTDRVFDTGRIAGELAHFFMVRTGRRSQAEPFIGHFLWEYAGNFPDRERAFESMNRRIPFYMGINFLRIARNGWLHTDYRKRLVHEAKKCLRQHQL